jgi:hypothetical protein
MVCSVDDRDVNVRFPEELRGKQSSKTRPDDDDAMASSMGTV